MRSKGLAKAAAMLGFFGILFGTFISFGLAATPSVCSSIKPVQLIVQELLPDRIPRKLLMKPQISPHDFQFTASQAKTASDCHTIVYVADFLESQLIAFNLVNKNSVPLFQLLDSKERLWIPINNSKAPDPHFWLSPSRVRLLLPHLQKELCEQLEDSCSAIQDKSQNFDKRLRQLSSKLSGQRSHFKQKSLISAHHSLAYLADELGLDYLGAVESFPEVQVGTKSLVALMDLARNKQLKVIYAEPQLSEMPITSLAQEANLKILMVDPLGASETIKTYFDLIEYNLQILLEGQNQP